MELIYETSDELMHYGVKGMKWGVRKEYNRANRARKTASRHVASSRRHMLDAANDADESVSRYNAQAKAYKDSAGRLAFTKKQKAAKEEDLREQEKRLHEAGEDIRKSKAEFAKAKAWYEADAADYSKKVGDMLREYGADSVKDVKRKNYKVGESFAETLIDTGITMADLPVVGKRYRERYIADLDAKQRVSNIDSLLEKERKEYY